VKERVNKSTEFKYAFAVLACMRVLTTSKGQVASTPNPPASAPDNKFAHNGVSDDILGLVIGQYTPVLQLTFSC